MQAVYGYFSTITTKNNILGHIKLYVSPGYLFIFYYYFIVSTGILKIKMVLAADWKNITLILF